MKELFTIFPIYLPLAVWLILVATFAALIGTVVHFIRNAPIGHEDEDGFHTDIEPNDLKEEQK
jgi:hypothetical protein